MTVEEFDTQFDIFYNNIASNAAPSVDTYEKSVFLTQAQRDIVVELYSGRAIPGVSFESTEEARSYLRELITSKTYKEAETKREILLDEGLLFILTESAVDVNGYSPIVVPERLDYLQRDLKNPFRGPSKERVLRVDTGSNTIKLYSIIDLQKYTISYIRTPKPIILGDLGGLTIEDSKEIQTSELNPILHKVILDRAVALAKKAYLGK